MKNLIALIALLSSLPAFADKNEVIMAGKINEVVCDQHLIRSVQSNKCIVSYSGTSPNTTSVDGTVSSYSYEGMIAVMDTQLNPLSLAGKNVYLTIDLLNSEIKAWGERN